MLILFTLFVKTAEAQSIAEVSLWLHQKYSNKTCGDITLDEFNKIQQRIDPKCKVMDLQNSTENLSENLNSIAEALFFENQAQAKLDELNCEISNLNIFSGDEALIKARSVELASKLPVIKELTKQSQKNYFDFKKLSDEADQLAGFCRNTKKSAQESCLSELSLKRIRVQREEDKWKESRGLLMATMGSLWSGSTKSMSEFLEKLLKYESPLSDQIIFEAFKKRIPKVKDELENEKLELIKLKKDSRSGAMFESMNDEMKRKLVEHSLLIGGAFYEASNRQEVEDLKLICHLEGKYTKGRDSLYTTVGLSTMFLGGVSGIAAKLPLALRGSSLSYLFSKTKSSLAYIGALSAAADTSFMASALMSRCFSGTLNFEVKNACPVSQEELRKSEIKKIEQNNCVLDTILIAAPTGTLAASKSAMLLKSSFSKKKPIQKQALDVSPNMSNGNNSGYVTGTQAKGAFTPSMKYPAPAKGSLSEKLNYKETGEVNGNYFYSYPEADTLNAILKLDTSSKLRAVKIEGLIDNDLYHRNLSKGLVSVSSDSPHDALDHFVGYWWLSTTPAWEKMKNIFKQYFQLFDQVKSNTLVQATSLQLENLSELRKLKVKLGDILENTTDKISAADRTGKIVERDDLLKKINQQIDEIDEMAKYIK